MLGHVSLRVLDLEASIQLYLSMLGDLGYTATRFPEVVGLGSNKGGAPIPDFWLRKYTPGPDNNNAAKPTPVHVSFYAEDRNQVARFHEEGLKAGGRCNGKPGLRPYMKGYYCGFFCFLFFVSRFLLGRGILGTCAWMV